MESFSNIKGWERMVAGLKGGSWNTPPAVTQRRIVNGWPSDTLAKLGMQLPQQPNIIDGWNTRRNK